MKKSKKKKGDEDESEKEEEKTLKIDLEGIQLRIVAVPVDAGDYSNLGSHKENQFLYMVRSAGKTTMHSYDLEERKDEEVAEMNGYMLSADGKKMLYRKGPSWGIADAGKKPEAGKGILDMKSAEIRIDPLSEWPQIFDEAWRINRDYFYDPGMHGADWKAMKEKYAQFLPDLACRADLNRVVMWMCSELAVGHHRTGGGDRLGDPERVSGGLLGADFKVENDRYRIVRIFEGLNWNPDLRSPLTEPGLNVKAGEYLLAVNGKELTAATNLYQPFENTSGKIVDLKVGPNPDGTGARDIQVVPVSSEYALRNRDWVEGNLKKVNEATNGQVAYVYVPNTTTAGPCVFQALLLSPGQQKGDYPG